MRALLIPAILATLAAPAVAGDLPFAPPTPVVNAEQAKLGAAAFARTFTIGKISGRFEKTQLSDVQKRLGGQIEKQGDAGDFVQWLCYDLPAKHQRLWLSASEINGGTVGQVTVWSVTSPANSAHCPALSDAAVSVDGIVSAGAAQTDIVKKLGKPGLDKGGWIAYRHESPAGGFTESDTLAIKLENGRVTHFQAGRLTSN